MDGMQYTLGFYICKARRWLLTHDDTRVSSCPASSFPAFESSGLKGVAITVTIFCNTQWIAVMKVIWGGKEQYELKEESWGERLHKWCTKSDWNVSVQMQKQGQWQDAKFWHKAYNVYSCMQKVFICAFQTGLGMLYGKDRYWWVCTWPSNHSTWSICSQPRHPDIKRPKTRFTSKITLLPLWADCTGAWAYLENASVRFKCPWASLQIWFDPSPAMFTEACTSGPH